jgi:4-hydroxy-tetrahydrodipicolinate synthase
MRYACANNRNHGFKKMQLHGSITALATPFKGGPFKGNEVDEKTFERFVDWQIREGSHGVVVNGTTAESPTLSEVEQDRLIEVAIKVTAGRVPVIVGTGSNNTAHTIHRTQVAAKLKADAALVVVPYYNKPTQEGLYQHFKAVHDANQIPILLYNVPGRTVTDILPPTVRRLAQLPRIIGIKDATGDLSRPPRTRADCGADFIQLTGDDATILAFLAQGGVGCISVISNVAPRACAEIQNAWARGDRAEAARLRDILAPLAAAMFAETSPAPVKYGMSLLGFGSDDMRLPMLPCSEATRELVRRAMEALPK